MRRRIEELADRFEEFVSEDDHDALVLTLRGEAAAGVVGAAFDLSEQRGSVDVTIPLLSSFEGAEAHAEHLVTWIATFARDEELALPAETRWASTVERAQERLGQLARVIGARGARLVLVLCPDRIASQSEADYVALALALAHSATERRARVKLVVRETDAPRVRTAVAIAAIATLEATIDATPTAIRDAMAEEAADPSHDRATRAAALLTVALADVGAGRAEQALPMLVMLAALFAELGDGSSRALSVIAAGNALWHLDRLDEARACISRGLAIALEAHAAPVVMAGGMLAGHLSMRVGDAADADRRFDVVARLGAHAGSPFVVTEALFARGEALEERGLFEDAADVWMRAAETARLAAIAPRERAALANALRMHERHGASVDGLALGRRLVALEHVPHAACGHEHAS